MRARKTLCGILALACGATAADAATVRRRAIPPLMAEAPYMPVFCQPRALAKGFGDFARVHTARRGALIVPPGDYARGLAPPDQHDPDSGNIYDIAFLTVDRDGLMLELRAYSGADLVMPKSSRIVSFPMGTRTIRLRHLAITITALTATSMSYSVAIEPSDAPYPQAEAGGETEVLEPDYCNRAMQDVIVAPTGR